MKKVLSSTARIRFQDCDPYQHLNNTKYLDYFINAREDQIKEHLGLDIYDLAQTEERVWVVGQHQISYLDPAFVMEEVIMESQVFDFSKKKVMIEMRMFDSKRKRLKAVLWSTMIHYNLTTKQSMEHSDHLIQLFSEVLNPIEEQHFSNRVIKLKTDSLHSS